MTPASAATWCFLAIAIAISATPPALSQSMAWSNIRIATFFSRFGAKPDHFSKFLYARNVQTGKEKHFKHVVDQMLASELSILGRPNEASRLFPSGASRMALDALPDKGSFIAVSAVDYILKEAATRQVVMVNEAHHRPQTRLLTLALLPKMRLMGYTHFAAEAVDAGDAALATRGYPIEKTGFYIGEPIYGEIIREALRLGYVVVPYEPASEAGTTAQDRETGQAAHLSERVFKSNPNAKLFVHAGYAHIDKSPGQLPDDARPMALEFNRLTGIVPLSVDQTTLEYGSATDTTSAYHHLLGEFAVTSPTVLVSRATQKAWSFRTTYHDVTVLLPTPSDDLRPRWLDLEGKRQAVAVGPSACLQRLPCLIEARYAAEAVDAVPADQFVVLSTDELETPLYLAPGKYRIRLRRNDGKTVSSRNLEVAPRPRAAESGQSSENNVPRHGVTEPA